MGESIFAKLKAKGRIVAFPDAFVEHGKTSDLLRMYNMDADSIKKTIIREAGVKNEA